MAYDPKEIIKPDIKSGKKAAGTGLQIKQSVEENMGVLVDVTSVASQKN